jgi:hypothetical protein
VAKELLSLLGMPFRKSSSELNEASDSAEKKVEVSVEA